MKKRNMHRVATSRATLRGGRWDVRSVNASVSHMVDYCAADPCPFTYFHEIGTRFVRKRLKRFDEEGKS